MPESPRIRRLKSDHRALSQLAADSTVFDFSAYGTPPDFYILRFHGRGFWKPDLAGEVLIREEHEVHVRLGASYPRMMPELAWKSPVFHPNVSSSGVVCLGGYGTYWVPSLLLDELCCMLWDMLRFENFDENSPYNREAAAWAKNQTFFRMPIDNRPLRNKLAVENPSEEAPVPTAPPGQPSRFASPQASHGSQAFNTQQPSNRAAASPQSPRPEVRFVGEVIEAEIVPSSQPEPDADVLYLL